MPMAGKGLRLADAGFEINPNFDDNIVQVLYHEYRILPLAKK